MARTGRLAWFHCFAGIAGDMALGSLVDAGADLRELERLLDRLPIGGWSLEFEPVLRNGLAATRAIVGARGDGVVRTFPHVMGILEEARLPTASAIVPSRHSRCLPRSKAVFTAGRPHRCIFTRLVVTTRSSTSSAPPRRSSCSTSSTVSASPVATGLGMVRSAHGLLPNPAPAVVELLEGIPTEGRDVNVELTTPTGAAMLAAWGSTFGPMPAMTIEATGFGAGARELDDLPELHPGRRSGFAGSVRPCVIVRRGPDNSSRSRRTSMT